MSDDGTIWMMGIPVALAESLIEPEQCSFDHHGGCQSHGYLTLEPGWMCPQADLKRRVAAVRKRIAGEQPYEPQRIPDEAYAEHRRSE